MIAQVFLLLGSLSTQRIYLCTYYLYIYIVYTGRLVRLSTSGKGGRTHAISNPFVTVYHSPRPS